MVLMGENSWVDDGLCGREVATCIYRIEWQNTEDTEKTKGQTGLFIPKTQYAL